MYRSSSGATRYSTDYLSDGSPVLVVHVGPEENRRAAQRPHELPQEQEPIVVVYHRPTLRQSWAVIIKGFRMLSGSIRSSAARYLRLCNTAYTHLSGIHIRRK